VIAVRDLAKVFDQGSREVRALGGVTLDIREGEFVSVMGPSGSGKSTLLHLIAGLDRPTSGEIQVDGVGLTGLSDTELTLFRRDRIGLIFQFFNLLPTLTAEENVALPLLLAGRRMRRSASVSTSFSPRSVSPGGARTGRTSFGRRDATGGDCPCDGHPSADPARR